MRRLYALAGVVVSCWAGTVALHDYSNGGGATPLSIAVLAFWILLGCIVRFARG